VKNLLLIAALASFSYSAQAQTVIEKRPVTACEADNMRLLKIIVDLRAEPDIQFVAVPVAAKPASKPRACPVLRGNKKCKRGRWQSPKHNCKCGKW
jgi:hypothetical protein